MITPNLPMDTLLIPLIHQLYNKWIAAEQDGELFLSATTIQWKSSDQATTLDLTPKTQVPFTELLAQIRLRNPIQRLKAYFDLGKFLDGKTQLDLQEYTIKPFTLKAAKRVYQFYTVCGEHTLYLDNTVTATNLAKLSEANFIKAIEERQTILLLFAGAQNETEE